MEPVSSPVAEVFSPWIPGVLSLTVYTLLIVGMLIVILLLTAWLGVKNTGPEKLRAYESGIIPTGGPAPNGYSVGFYLVATFFLIFDVEAVYIFSWAIAFESLGWMGWLRICFFIVVLLASLFYIWMKGGLEWGTMASQK